MEQIELGSSFMNAKLFQGSVSGGGRYGPGMCEKVIGLDSRGCKSACKTFQVSGVIGIQLFPPRVV
jgi:hypothetical protein